MLFIGHSAATVANAGKVYFMKDPMVINYPQWMAFAKYSYQQLKWVLLHKANARDAYVGGILFERIILTFMVNLLFSLLSLFEYNNIIC